MHFDHIVAGGQSGLTGHMEMHHFHH